MDKGFTLMELVIVIVIIGILAMIALPQVFKVSERARAAEAINALGAARDAQLRYVSEKGATTERWDDLDIPQPVLRFFDGPTLILGVGPTNSTAVVAKAQRNEVASSSGKYILSIQLNGVFTCSGGTGDICAIITPASN
jgi:prepilin-type N-terminal cleavage/methylation domain-containing protein